MPANPAPPAPPDLSVVLVIGEHRDRAQRALNSLLAQSAAGRMEILLLDCTPDAAALQHTDQPAVRELPVTADTLFPDARAQGVRQARAPIVAFIEEHCMALPGWAAALIAAFDGPWAGVGCEVHNANPDVGTSNATMIINYLPWIAPATAGECRQIPGQNSAYRRDVLLAYGARLPELLVNDTVLQWTLLADGHRLAMAPAARFAHTNETSMGSIGRGHYFWNRSLAPARADMFGWSRARRLLTAAATPIIPWVRLARQGLAVARSRPHLLGQFLARTPLILGCNYYSAAGQMVGLLFGAGDAGIRLSRYELAEYRDLGTGK